MPRCELTGKKPVVKHLVSHSNIKTKSRAFPNIHVKSFYSPCLKRAFRLKIASSTIRSMDKAGGFDNFLMKCQREALSPFALKLRKNMEKVLHKKPKHHKPKGVTSKSSEEHKKPKHHKPKGVTSKVKVKKYEKPRIKPQKA